MSDPNPRVSPAITGLPASERVLVAVIPVLGAVFACLYDAGYLLSFGIPLEYVELTWPRMLMATSLVVLYSLLIYLMTGTEVRAAFHRHVPRTKVLVGGVIVVALVVGYFALVLRSSSHDLSPYLGSIWVLTGIVAYGYGEKLVFVLGASKRLRSGALEPELESSRSRAIRRLAANAAGLVLFAGIFATLMGYSIAQTKHDFLALQGAENFLLVRESHDVMIFAGYDRATNRLTSQLRLVRVNEGRPLDLVKVSLPESRPLNY